MMLVCFSSSDSNTQTVGSIMTNKSVETQVEFIIF